MVRKCSPLSKPPHRAPSHPLVSVASSTPLISSGVTKKCVHQSLFKRAFNNLRKTAHAVAFMRTLIRAVSLTSCDLFPIEDVNQPRVAQARLHMLYGHVVTQTRLIYIQQGFCATSEVLCLRG